MGTELAVLGETERKRVEAVVETLANLGNQGESLAEVAHDARNMVTALSLYCELLAEPGVLNPSFAHYGGELTLVAAASRRLVEKLVALDTHYLPAGGEQLAGSRTGLAHKHPTQWDPMPPMPIENLAHDLLANRNLLSALAGPSIALTIDVEGGAKPVRLSGEDFTRILVNLVRNATEAISGAGRIHITLRESLCEPDNIPGLTLNVEDNGRGIPWGALETVFDAGYTTRSIAVSNKSSIGWPAPHRGLGLPISRSILEAAGGSIHAANRDPEGACFQIQLPVRTR